MALDVEIKRCCVLNCSTQRAGKNDVSKIAMHKLPLASNPSDDASKQSRGALRTRWLFLSGREEKDITAENEYICGKHFLPNAYHHLDSDNKKLRKLNQNAEPSVFLPPSKENAVGKKTASSYSTESEEHAGSAGASPNSEENEMNCEMLPSTDADEISPLELDTSNSKDSNEPEYFEFEFDDSSWAEKKTISEKCSLGHASMENGVKNSIVSKLSDEPPESIVINSPKREESDELLPNGTSLSKEAIDEKSTAKVARVVPAAKPNTPAASSLNNLSVKLNGCLDASKSNGTSVGPSAKPASKRRFCEDSDGEPSMEFQRKKLTDEQKSQARMKICPRRSDLQAEAAAIHRPDVVAGSHNKYAYLKGFTEALLTEALRQLRGAFENQSTQMTRIFEQLVTESGEIEKRYEDVTCRLNACKRSGSSRNVGIQMSSLNSSLPILTAEVAFPLQSSSKQSTSSATVAVAQPMPYQARRGRPPNHARFSQQSQNVRAAVTPEPVIDLTDDQPSVSIVRAPNAATSHAVDPRLSATTSKHSASYSRVPDSTANSMRVLPNVGSAKPSVLNSTLTPTSSSSAVPLPTSSSFSTTPPGPRFSSPPTSSSVLAASAPPQPVPVGSIFPGQQLANRTMVRPAVARVISPGFRPSAAQNKMNVVGTTFRLPPGTVVRPVIKNSALSSAVSSSNETADEEKFQQQQPAKTRPSINRARHPAPLPETPLYDIGELHTPPAPLVDVKANDNGIQLTWDLQLQKNLKYSPADRFQIFTYTEGDKPPSTDLWRNIGTVNALQLPMVVTLCSYKPGHRYFFAVRGVDRLNRVGAFNEPKAVDLRESIVL